MATGIGQLGVQKAVNTAVNSFGMECVQFFRLWMTGRLSQALSTARFTKLSPRHRDLGQKPDRSTLLLILLSLYISKDIREENVHTQHKRQAGERQ